jgi:hypothetical protein
VVWVNWLSFSLLKQHALAMVEMLPTSGIVTRPLLFLLSPTVEKRV